MKINDQFLSNTIQCYCKDPNSTRELTRIFKQVIEQMPLSQGDFEKFNTVLNSPLFAQECVRQVKQNLLNNLNNTPDENALFFDQDGTINIANFPTTMRKRAYTVTPGALS
jgi:hypothetical protein